MRRNQRIAGGEIMHIITNFESLVLNKPDFSAPESDVRGFMDDLRHDVFESIESAYQDAVLGSDWYLYQSYGENQFLFGGIDPDKLIATAQSWNQDIRKAVGPALVAADIISANGQFAMEKMQMNTPGTYEAKIALRELDNDWFPVANHAVYVNNEFGIPYFCVHLLGKTLEDIIAHPENYIIIEVVPK